MEESSETQSLLNMEERNVVIIGKAGAGKRTIANRIVGKDIFQTESASAARDICHYKELWTENTHYRILTIDTAGLNTGPRNPLPYIKQRFEMIHLVIFVTTKGRYTDESHNSFIHAVQSLHQQAKPFCALIITHCESITKENRQKIIEGFKAGDRSSEVASRIKENLFYTVGLPDISKVELSMKESYQKEISEDEKAIRRLVKECTSSLNVQDLAVIQPNCCEKFCALCRACWEKFCALCRACWESPCCALCRACCEFICLCCRGCCAMFSCIWSCCRAFYSFCHRCWERIRYQRVE